MPMKHNYPPAEDLLNNLKIVSTWLKKSQLSFKQLLNNRIRLVTGLSHQVIAQNDQDRERAISIGKIFITFQFEKAN